MALTQGRLIKASVLGEKSAFAPSERRSRVVAARRVEAELSARAVLAAADAEAKRRLRAAGREAQQLAMRAREEGLAAGEAALLERQLALVEREQAALEARSGQLLELGRLLAERLIGRELQLSPEVGISLAEQLLAEARGARRVELQVPPSELPRLEAARGALSARHRFELSLVPNAALSSGQMRLVTEHGALDLSLAAALDRLVARLSGSDFG